MPALDPSGFTVLVTGATSGFGETIALGYLARGARVIASGRRAERLEALRKKHPERAWAAPMDVTRPSSVDEALRAIPEPFRDIDVLVNNAGLALGLDKAHEASWDDWERMIDTNVKGLAYVTRAVLPGMVRRGRGYVVNIGSVAGTYPYPGGNVYGAAKAFVTQLSLGLRADLLGTPVRVTCIEPGLAETEFSTVRFYGDSARARKVYEGAVPLSAEDVAEAVLWCTTLPPHVNVNRIEMMPTGQAPGALQVHRAGG